MNRLTTSALAALIALTTAAGCGGDDDAADPTGTSASTASSGRATTAASGVGSDTTAASVTTDGAVVATAAAPDGSTGTNVVPTDPDGVLRFAHSWEPSRFDPHRASNGNDATTLFLTYDRLIHMNEQAEPVPGLAESWEFSDDGTALVLHLRDGVTFHDGTPFDAAAVKANIDRAKVVEGSVVVADLQSVESVDVVDPMTARLNLTQPDASLLGALSDRAGAMVSPAALDSPDLDASPVGTGMYTVTEFLPGDHITYERYADYWDPDAQGARQIQYLIMTDAATRLNALRSGQADVATLATTQVAEAEQAGLNVVVRTTLAFMHLQLNRAVEPFDDVDVRRALSYAIDRQAIVDAIEAGHGAVNSQVFPEGYFGYDEATGSDAYPYDPDKARELLATAGYPDGFSFTLWLPTSLAPQLAEAIQAQLAEVGITMDVAAIQPQEAADIFYTKDQGSSILGPWSGRPDPSITLGQLFTAAGYANPGGASTPEAEELAAQALTELDPDKRAAIIQQLSALGSDEIFDLVLYNTASVLAYTDDVAVPPVIGLTAKPEFRGAGMAQQ